MNKSFKGSAVNNAAMRLGTGLLSVVIAFMPMVATAQTQYVSPLEQVGAHSKSSHKNIGILITFGTGNSVTPDEAGKWAVKQLDAYAATQGKSYNAQYFVQHTDKGEGIAVSYSVGVAQGVGPKDISDAKNPEVLNEVFEKREMTANLLNNTRPQ